MGSPSPNIVRDLVLAMATGTVVGGAAGWWLANLFPTATVPEVPAAKTEVVTRHEERVEHKASNKTMVVDKARVATRSKRKLVTTTENFDPGTGVLVKRVRVSGTHAKSRLEDVVHAKATETNEGETRTKVDEAKKVEVIPRDLPREGVGLGLVATGEGVGLAATLTLTEVRPVKLEGLVGIVPAKHGPSPRLGLGLCFEPLPRLGVGAYACLAPASDPLGYPLLPGVDLAPAVAVHYEF